MCAAIVVLCIMAASWERYKVKALENEMELQAYKVYEESYKNLITEIRVRQHDFKNHINAIYIQHMMCNTYEELVERQKKYCEDLVYENRFADLLRLGDSMVIGFLYGKLAEADSKGIEVDYLFQCGEMKTNLPMYKIITILGNLINNAIEALEQNDRKQLFVSITEDGKELRMEVRNTNEPIAWSDVTSLFKKGYSTKGEGRGLGLYSIKKMSREYGFDILFANKEIDGVNWVSFEIRIRKE
ncbi:MAG: GHKL domain-containing protein [Alistipes sp.]|nr:GHKL domain-containing protein [Alistipes sp.]